MTDGLYFPTVVWCGAAAYPSAPPHYQLIRSEPQIDGASRTSSRQPHSIRTLFGRQLQKENIDFKWSRKGTHTTAAMFLLLCETESSQQREKQSKTRYMGKNIRTGSCLLYRQNGSSLQFPLSKQILLGMER